MLSAWNEFSQLESWLWDRTRGLSPLRTNGDSRQPLWHPAVDAHEDAARILLVADLPGLEQRDIDITVENNVLVVRGERKPEAHGDGTFHTRERVQGPFSRAFALPATVDVDAIAAEMKAGVLTILLPKKSEARPRQIKVNSVST